MAEGADRKRFTLLTEAWEDWRSLSLEKRGILITAIILYQRGEKVPDMDAETSAVFRPIRRQLDEQYEKQLRKKKVSQENGAKGGRPKRSEPERPSQVRRVVLADTPDGFDEFWKAYPKKVGKAEARKSWGKIKPGLALQEKMLETIRQARESNQWRKDGGKYIPNPATWLNQGRWDDDVSTYSRNVKTVQTNFHNMDSRPGDDLEAWALKKQLAELNGG